MTLQDPQSLYDQHYYETGCGLPYEHTEAWTKLFGNIADAIIDKLHPTTVLDAGCAMGFLVEALRDRGVEAYGIDISEYAISKVPESVKPFCWVGSITEPLPARYDLVISIEVLEHLQPEDVVKAIRSLCEASNDILFSSSPDDVTTPSHFCVQPQEQWASQFAEHGFWHDVDFDASFITNWAMRFLKSDLPAYKAFVPVERKVWSQQAEIAQQQTEIAQQQSALARQQVEFEQEITKLEAALESVEWRLSETETRLNTATWQLRWLDGSRGVRLVKLARASRALLRKNGPFSLTKRMFLWAIGKRGYHLKDPTVALPVPTTKPKTTTAYKQVLFLSGCPGDALRYRCIHQVEQLEMLGCSSDFATYGLVDLGGLLDRYQFFIFHRVPYGEDIRRFLEQAKQRGKPVIFETDDLVFDPDVLHHVAALEDLPPDDKALYIEGVNRYRTTLLNCAAVNVSTETLRDLAQPLHEIVTITPNVVSREMVRLADIALSNTHSSQLVDRNAVTIAYFSGTPTHSRDFAVAEEAIAWAMEKYPQVHFKLIGNLRLNQGADPIFSHFGKRFERVPLQPWQHLPEIYAEVDINLAPLEPNNVFTESKSNIKFLEAALMRVPTIASPRRDFLRVVEPGVNGLLAETPDEWRHALSQLIESRELRTQIGNNAYETVRAKHTTLAQAPFEYETLRDVYRRVKRVEFPSGERKLRVNWLVRAPIAGRGGGYRTIFRLANSLSLKGHTVRVYVERIAHLEHMTDSQVSEFMNEHFGPLHFQVYVGHHHLLPADATIATNWPTAYTVAEHDESLFKFYFIQDYEPEFYGPREKEYRAAERTYKLPLQHIAIGSHLAKRIEAVSSLPSRTIDFAMDGDVFNLTRAPEDRVGPVKVLFFARPGLKRRGFELGVEALKRVKAQRPNVEIFTFGCSDDELGVLPFASTNLGILEPSQLAQTMNSMHILLTFSLSNISWVPFEGMACGMAVVEADVPSVRDMVVADEMLLLAPVEPEAAASAVIRLVDDSSLRVQIATHAADEMSRKNWKQSTDQFETLLLEQCW